MTPAIAEISDPLRGDAAIAARTCVAVALIEFGDHIERLPLMRRTSEQWFSLLARPRWLRTQALRRIKRELGLSDTGLERFVMLASAPATAARIERMPVDMSVKRNLCQLLARLPNLARNLEGASWPFHELAQALTLQRFVAGQHNWVVGGAGRAPLLRMRVRPAHVARLLQEVALRYGGFAPVASIHLNPWRDKPTVMLRAEACRSLYRIARSLELQPRLKGIQGMSWMHSRQIGSVSPHLAWAHDLFAENGAMVAEMETAPPDSGVLTGSAERKRLYESGAFRPRVSVFLWHRDNVLDWAARHPEFSEAASASVRTLPEHRVNRHADAGAFTPHLVA